MTVKEIKETILEMNDYGIYEDTGMIINNFIDSQQQKISDYEEIIKSLKNCSNCKYALTKSQIGLKVNTYCKSCASFSSWEIEE